MDEKLSDGKLVKETLDGNSEAFTALVCRYQDVVYAAAYSIVRNFHDAKDIAQEAWINAYQKLITYDPNRHFGPWIYRISKRCAVDWLRKRGNSVVDNLSAALNIVDPRLKPDEEQEKRELYDIVNRALLSLSEVNRETTVLYYINGYSQMDVSRILNVPLGTVKRRLHDSRKLLREEVMDMVKEAFEKNKLEWEFTQDVVNRVSELKKNLVDYLPDKFQELARMPGDKLNERRNNLLRSLFEALSISPEEAGIEKTVTVRATDLSTEQKEYLWQTIHELELMDILSTIKSGSSFSTLIRDFDKVEVEFGRYGTYTLSDGKVLDKDNNKLYVRLYRPWPDGGAHSIQMGPLDD